MGGIWEELPKSDLAVERRRADTELRGVQFKRQRCAVGEWERILITDEEGAKSIGRPMGSYDTLTVGRMDHFDSDRIDDAADEVARQLCLMCDRISVYPDRILVVGLGNRELTPDAVGPITVSRVEATLHLCRSQRELFEGLECSEIAAIEPGVAARTGIESRDTVIGVCSRIRPDLVIAVDSIAARAPQRLGTTLQFSDTGIRPGSGLRKGDRAIDENALGIPVLSIGVPTVIDARLLCQSSELGDLFVSPKDINAVVETAGRIIAAGINQAFGIFG